MLNAQLAVGITEALAGALGGASKIDDLQRLGGGFSRNFRLRWGGQAVFLKLASAELLEAEADGLRALAQCTALRVPQVFGCGSAGGGAFLAMEWLALTDSGSEVCLGEAIAALHEIHYPRYGWDRDNFLGASPQHNAWCEDWVDFFAARRLEPQLAWAAAHGAPDLVELAVPLLAGLAQFFPEPPPKALLHGDFWAGNKGFVGNQPAIFDPAVHVGDPECDLAMAELFGGFSQDFFAAHAAVHPRKPWHVERQALYQLYHILNHFQLFGGAYAGSARALIARLLAYLR